MNTDFKDAMSNRTDEELIKIVTVSKNDYQPQAVEAAEQEIKNRGINTDIIEQTTINLTTQIDERLETDNNRVSSFSRFKNFVIDSIVWILIVSILTYPLDANDENQYFIGCLILILTIIGYYSFMETKYQKTVAKFITKTSVVMKDGTKPKFGDILKRTFCRLIPFDRVSFLFTKNGFHDNLSNTTVVKDEN